MKPLVRPNHQRQRDIGQRAQSDNTALVVSIESRIRTRQVVRVWQLVQLRVNPGFCHSSLPYGFAPCQPSAKPDSAPNYRAHVAMVRSLERRRNIEERALLYKILTPPTTCRATFLLAKCKQSKVYRAMRICLFSALHMSHGINRI